MILAPTVILAQSLRGSDVVAVDRWLGPPARTRFVGEEVWLGYLDANATVRHDAVVLVDGIVVRVESRLRSGRARGGDGWFARPIEVVLPRLGPVRAALTQPAGLELRFKAAWLYVHEGRVVGHRESSGDSGLWLLPRPAFTAAS